jgi:D-alanyl-D-alanine-carboxypeptidase/D-alanyl-D-alanine-endopeptidase
MNKPAHALFATVLLAAMAACNPPADDTFEKTLAQRMTGDRTGACVAAATIGPEVEWAVACANAEAPRDIDATTAFEIGSITKTMTAFLLAELVHDGALTLDDPLAEHLPAGTPVPSFAGEPIRLRHLLTHTAGLPGLPSRLVIDSLDDPYADFSVDGLLASLGDVTLASPPGSQWAYSNFGFMLLSYVVATERGQDIEDLLQQRLFQPLGMSNAYIDELPAGTQAAQGHLATGVPAPAWHFPRNLEGVGGVRASLDDMIRYAEALRGRGDADVVASLAKTMETVPSSHGAPAMGMAWLKADVDGQPVVLHDGGTGGFSSLLVLEPASGRAVVLLFDTALGNLGGGTDIAMHLLYPDTHPMPPARLPAEPSQAVLDCLSGQHSLAGIPVKLESRAGALVARLAGTPELGFAYDSYGDFYPLDLDALLTPVELGDGRCSFDWTQGGERTRAERLP